MIISLSFPSDQIVITPVCTGLIIPQRSVQLLVEEAVLNALRLGPLSIWEARLQLKLRDLPEKSRWCSRGCQRLTT